MQRLEPYAVKVARTVLRGGGDGNATSLPDVRHEVVDVAVMPLEYGHYLRFRRQYPTGTRVVGNDEVRSFRDNVTSSFGRAAKA